MKVTIYVGVAVIVLVIVIVIFACKKIYSTKRQEAITLTNFDINPGHPIIEEDPRSLTDEENEFDELVSEYNRIRKDGEAQKVSNGKQITHLEKYHNE